MEIFSQYYLGITHKAALFLHPNGGKVVDKKKDVHLL
jgi:hypothetical protein